MRQVSLGLAGVWAARQVGWPGWPATAAAATAASGSLLAFLADAHLQDGDDHRPEAQSLARAVAELRGLQPAPQLVLFAGDLAHNGHPAALALGREILSDLPAPCLLLMGEGDCLPDAAALGAASSRPPGFPNVLSKTENRPYRSAHRLVPGTRRTGLSGG